MPLATGFMDVELNQHPHRAAHISFVLSLCVMAAAGLATQKHPYASLVVLVAAELIVLVALAVAKVTGRLEHGRNLVWWPIAVLATVFAFSRAAPGAILLVSGLIVLTFLFIGLTLPPGRTVYFLLPASAVVVYSWNLPLAETLVRLPVATLVWFMVGEIPSRLIYDLRQQRNLLRKAAATDSLTGLLNRSTLASELGQLTDHDAIAVIDLDHFKAYNDKFGHLSGDDALRDFANILTGGCRADDKIFRYGGEEFLIIFRSTSVDGARDILRRIAAIEPSGTEPLRTERLSFSAGITVGGPDAVRRGDLLLYEAKASGRDRIHIHTIDADQRFTV